jgi:hypothetical protein
MKRRLSVYELEQLTSLTARSRCWTKGELSTTAEH